MVLTPGRLRLSWGKTEVPQARDTRAERRTSAEGPFHNRRGLGRTGRGAWGAKLGVRLQCESPFWSGSRKDSFPQRLRAGLVSRSGTCSPSRLVARRSWEPLRRAPSPFTIRSTPSFRPCSNPVTSWEPCSSSKTSTRTSPLTGAPVKPSRLVGDTCPLRAIAWNWGEGVVLAHGQFARDGGDRMFVISSFPLLFSLCTHYLS